MAESFRPTFGQEVTYSIAQQHDCSVYWCDHWSHGFEDEINYVPFSLTKCRLCFALVRQSGDLNAHMEFHWNQGWRP